MDSKSVEFFETQFQRQVRDQDYLLNPFEALAKEYVRGSVLDLGSGLGNLSLEAGRLGCRVLAVDASPTAVARINIDAHREGLCVHAIQADLRTWTIDQCFDTIVAIGVLSCFSRQRAFELLHQIQEHVNPDGSAFVNVHTDGTSYMALFDPTGYYLFGRNELKEAFHGWTILHSKHETFPAPGQTVKEFATVIARKPAAWTHGSL
jgi:tellurite methyltransferase